MSRLSDLEEAVTWVLDTTSEMGLGWVERATLTETPNRERFFEMLPELDYEIEGGTFEEPLWAWMQHPWYKRLGLTEDECVSILTKA